MHITPVYEPLPSYDSGKLLTNDGTALSWTDNLFWDDTDDFLRIQSIAGKQLQLRYDASNYSDFTVTAGGDLVITATGGDISTPDMLTVGNTLQMGSAEIVDSGGEISFKDDNLTTTGCGTFGNLDVDNFNINDSTLSSDSGHMIIRNEDEGADIEFYVNNGGVDTLVFQCVGVNGIYEISRSAIVNAAMTEQLGLELGGTGGPGATSRGGYIKWYRRDASALGGYAYYNTNRQVVFDSDVQASDTDTGMAWIETNTGVASFNKIRVGDTTSPTAQLEVTTAADLGHEALLLDQNDEDKSFIDFSGAEAADNSKNVSTGTPTGSTVKYVRVDLAGVEYWVKAETWA